MGASTGYTVFVWLFGIFAGGYHYALKMFVFEKVRLGMMLKLRRMPGSCCQSRCHLRLSGWVEGGGKKGKKGEGGRASADLEGLSGRGEAMSCGGGQL